MQRTKVKMKKRRQAALAAAIWIFLESSAFCAEEGEQAGEAERVTTEAVNVEAVYEKEMLKEAPETKTLITREDIDRKGARTLSDALAAEQDIQMGTDNMGRKTISIRGADPRHTLILVDGRRLAGGLSKFYGATDEANRIGLDNIDHIEIIRGSGTARYGADAIGGVINIVTKIPHKRGGTVRMERSWIGQGGSQYNHNVNFATGEIGKGIYMDFSYGKSKTAPFLYDKDGSSMQYYGQRTPMSARVEFTLGKGESLTLSADHLDEDLEKDTPLGKMLKMNALEDAWRRNISIDWKKQTDAADFRVRAYRTQHDSDVNYEIGPIVPGTIPYHHFYFDYFNREDRVLEASLGVMLQDKHYLTVGADYHKESGEGTRIYMCRSKIRGRKPEYIRSPIPAIRLTRIKDRTPAISMKPIWSITALILRMIGRWGRSSSSSRPCVIRTTAISGPISLPPSAQPIRCGRIYALKRISAPVFPRRASPSSIMTGKCTNRR